MLRGYRKWLALGALALVAAAGVYFATGGSVNELPGVGALGGDDERDAESNSTAHFAGGPAELLLVSGDNLQRQEIVSGEEETLMEAPADDLRAAPGSDWLAYVAAVGESTNDDFIEFPQLVLFNPVTDETRELGPGFSPLWHVSGNRIAFLHPSSERGCAGETCKGRSEVAVTGLDGEATTISDPGRWTLLAWSGDGVLAAKRGERSRIHLLSSDGVSDESIDMPVNEFWDASPDGRWIVRVVADTVEFVSVSDPDSKPIEVTLPPGSNLTDGSWAPDSSSVAATIVTPSTAEATGKKARKRALVGDPTSLVTFSPRAPEAVMVEGSSGAVGAPYWSPDLDALLFTRLVDATESLLQLTYCELATSGGCRIAGSYTRGVQPLRLE